MGIRYLRYLLNISFKQLNSTNAFLILGRVVPQTGPAITKASFQVISIWLGQRKFSFQIFLSYNHNLASSEKTLKIVWGKFIQCFIHNLSFLVFFLRQRDSFSHFKASLERRLELVSKGDLVITLAARFCDFCNLSLR